jgi:hypothetical protein
MEAAGSSESFAAFHQLTTRRHKPTDINLRFIFTAVRTSFSIQNSNGINVRMQYGNADWKYSVLKNKTLILAYCILAEQLRMMARNSIFNCW